MVLGTIILVFSGKIDAQDNGVQEISMPEAALDQWPLTAEQVATGWISLFDGHSLFGWRRESDANWRVEDGQIVVDAGSPGLLRTASQFDLFELIVEYRCDADTRSGVLLRTSPSPGPEDAIEIMIAGGQDEKLSGTIVGHRDVSFDHRNSPDEFDRMVVSVTPDGIRVSINTHPSVSLNADQVAVLRGYIGLKFDRGQVRFRKIALRPLNLFQYDEDHKLKGWKASQGNDFDAVFENGDMVLSGGPGYIESESRFANLMLQLKCKISGDGNSGVFYRCIPGENTNGYESQIHNGKNGGDWNQPSNCGTGGIFRRKDARQIVAIDDDWFAKTIVAEGPHVAVWVNGYQVTDWTDRRKPHTNPRRGLRTEAGTLMLQGHDADTTVRFREIKVREMDSRRQGNR